MNVRRYQMGSPRAKRLSRLLRNKNINVVRIEVAGHDRKEDTVYVFYNRVEEGEKKEIETLERLKAKAEEVAKDKVYQKLSNSKQRELFLLDHYGLSKRESVDVVELLKIVEIEASVAREKMDAALRNMEKESKKNEYTEKG